MEKEEEEVDSTRPRSRKRGYNATTKDTERIRCILRIRPRLNKSEVDLPQHVNVRILEVIVSPHGRRLVSREFELIVFSTLQLQRGCLQSGQGLDQVLYGGFNSTILAFGQSGSGKNAYTRTKNRSCSVERPGISRVRWARAGIMVSLLDLCGYLRRRAYFSSALYDITTVR